MAAELLVSQGHEVVIHARNAARAEDAHRALSRKAGSKVFSNALEPGWVPTKMGGQGAPDDMDQAHRTQVWLAAGDDPKADVSAEYFYHLTRRTPNPQAHDAALQDRLIDICAEISGVALSH